MHYCPIVKRGSEPPGSVGETEEKQVRPLDRMPNQGEANDKVEDKEV